MVRPAHWLHFISTVVGIIYLLGGYQIEASGIAYNFSIGALFPHCFFLFLALSSKAPPKKFSCAGGYFNY